MVKFSGPKQLKRSMAPVNWKINRKSKRFALRPSSGSHKITQSIPALIVIRDRLKLINNASETSTLIKTKNVTIDGKIIHDPSSPVGIMDVLGISKIGKFFRIVPYVTGYLEIIEVPEDETNKKICKIISKYAIKSGKLCYGLHDGRTIISTSESLYNVGDSLLIEVPSQKILSHIKLQKNTFAIITAGQNVGSIGKIINIKEATFSRKSMIDLDVSGTVLEVPTKSTILVGDDSPAIKLE